MFENIKNKLTENSRLMESSLRNYYSSENYDAIRLIETEKYGLLDGGKRIRAFLLLQICRLYGGSIDAAIPYASAIEMMHASSLMHDDLPCMDNDDYRRGKPSAHKALGETLALLGGDALIVKAFQAIATNRSCDALTNQRAAEMLARSSGDEGMLAGQTIDTVLAKEKLDFDVLIRLHQLKTGKLICASAALGCLAASIGEADERYKAAIAYAENVGLSFQIIDDILDYREGKMEINSFLAFMSEAEAAEYAKELTARGINAIKPFDDGTLEELANYLTQREF